MSARPTPFFVGHGMRDIFKGENLRSAGAPRRHPSGAEPRRGDDRAGPRGPPFDLMVDDINEARAEFTSAGVTATEIERGRIHDTFHIEGPSGYRFAVTSSHAGDRAV